MKQKIKHWNLSVFKNIYVQKEVVYKQLLDVNEQIISQGMDNTAFVKQQKLQEEWSELLLREEVYCCQKSRELWLKDGDRNTKFFHVLAQIKCVKNSFFSIQDNELGVFLTKEVDIQKEGIKFFSQLLSKDKNSNPQLVNDREELLEAIPKLICQEDNDKILSPFMLEEVKAVVFSLTANKAP